MIFISLPHASTLQVQRWDPLAGRTRFHALAPHPRPWISAAVTPRTPRTDRNPVVVVEPRDLPSPIPSNVSTAGGRRIRKVDSMVDPSELESTWAHRGWVGVGCTALLVSLGRSLLGSIQSHLWVEPSLAALVGYLLADLGSGVYHWGIDNYGGAETPFFGSQIAAFQGHHRRPSTITRRQFANNLHALARVVALSLLPLLVLNRDPVVDAFDAVFAGCIMFSQQFHAWAHDNKTRLPPAVVALQDAGVLVSRVQHAAHHRPPYDNNYCIVSGAWNRFLDEKKVFEAVEMVIFFRFGTRPRSWTEPGSNWTEEIQTSSTAAADSHEHSQ